MATPILIPETDVSSLQRTYRPGAAVSSPDVFEAYVKMMQASGRTPASRQALGRALTRAGWTRKLLRKRRGPQGKQVVVKLTSAWVVPGSAPIYEEDDRMAATLRVALDGREQAYIPSRTIWETYQQMARQHGWRWTLGQSGVSRWLRDHGFPYSTEGKLVKQLPGTPSRYVDIGRINMLAPLERGAEE